MNFIDIFNKKLQDKNISWDVKGILKDENTIITLGSDSKLISRIFELIVHNLLEEIAEENNYILEPSQSQTVYPDYTFIKKDEDGQPMINDKIAVDIKTTYKQYKKDGSLKQITFTLGSYTSFIRDEKGEKNIAYPYSQYKNHYAICFLYDRNEDASQGMIVSTTEINNLEIPYSNVDVFVQKKHLIVGEKPGSGNTANIGSFKTCEIEHLIDGNGPFKYLGEDIYLHYWKNYPTNSQKNKHYKSLEEYFDWLDNQQIDTKYLRKKYKEWEDSIN